MKTPFLVMIVVLIIVGVIAGGAYYFSTSPTPRPSPAPTETPAPTTTSTPTTTIPTPVPTPTSIPTSTPSPTLPPSPTPSKTSTPIPTMPPTSTPTIPPSPTPTSTPKPTPSPTPALKKPSARISANATSIRLGENVTLTAAGSSDPDGEIVEFKWVLSGTSPYLMYGMNVTVGYSTAGNYTVELVVKDNDGLTGSTKLQISVILEKYTLSEALGRGYVEANVTGVSGLLGGGVCAGDSIILQLKSLVTYTVEIEPLTTGTLLKPSGTVQEMVVYKLRGEMLGSLFFTPTNRIILKGTEAAKYLFSGYCVSFEKPNPNKNTQFSVSGTADEDVLKVLYAVKTLPTNVTSISAIQTAIFVVTDDISIEQLETRFPSGVDQIENAKTILTAAGIDISSNKLFA